MKHSAITLTQLEIDLELAKKLMKDKKQITEIQKKLEAEWHVLEIINRRLYKIQKKIQHIGKDSSLVKITIKGKDSNNKDYIVYAYYVGVNIAVAKALTKYELRAIASWQTANITGEYVTCGIPESLVKVN